MKKRCWSWKLFFIFMKSEKWSSLLPKNLDSDQFWNNVKKCMFFGATTSDFIQIKKICNSYLNYFQRLLFHYTFSHPMNFIFCLCTDAAYYKSRFIIKWNIKCILFIYFYSLLFYTLLVPDHKLFKSTIKSISHCRLIYI